MAERNEMIDEKRLRKLHDALHGTDADIAYGHLRLVIEEWESQQPTIADQDKVERVAKAIFRSCQGHPCPNDNAGATTYYEKAAQAAIAAMPEPQGWQPIETAPRDEPV